MTIKITVDIAGAFKNIRAIAKIGGHFIESQNIPVVFERSKLYFLKSITAATFKDTLVV